MDNFICGGYIFSSNFDSGNLHKVELVKWNEALPNNETVGVELNLWTRPDCAGTEYENLNRSWFFFSIQGGDMNKVCKLNIVNLNKQAKLFSQGMHPVIRIGDTGKWERMKESPSYDVYNGDFVLSFLHKPCTNISAKYYYAFTFPFTYTECQNQLARFDSLYEKTAAELNYVVQRLNSDVEPNRKIDTNGVENEQNLMNELPQNVKSISNIKAMENLSNIELENDIYYRRELLINSLEGRRIDLLTITSFHNIQDELEYRLNDLFPESHVKRCNLFKNKKIIFISSRVHPGETPASFMLNGFLKMILDRKNRYASILRKMYVFKIVPLLNPDGVYNGYYRSDTLGHNLNRVYLTPSKETQPSIFAVRKLVRYYHNAKNVDENEPFSLIIPTIDEIQEIDIANNNTNEVINFEMDSASTKTDPDSSSSTRDSSTGDKSPPRSSVLTEININAKNNRNLVKAFSPTPSTSSSSASPTISSAQSQTPDDESEPKPSCSTHPSSLNCPEESTNPNFKLTDTKFGAVQTAKTVFNDQFIVEIKPSMSTQPKNSTNESTVTANQSDDLTNESKQKCFWKPIESESLVSNAVKVKRISLKPSTQSTASKETPISQNVPNNQNAIPKDSARDDKKKEIRPNILKPNVNGANKTSARFSKKTALNPSTSGNLSGRSSARTQRKSNRTPIANSINISADFCCDGDPNGNGDDSSNMFLYIDLHGHASKKGVFMYGNYLPKPNEAVENMLLPRLMSLNCHHFHFDACVFSERNMYHKGKRDGLSKEGSGRVAIYKTIGLIKCYTLEGNYNSGKYVNILPPRGKEPNVRRVCTIPPKYTPVIFEEVGRALGPSILDLTDSNPISRLRNSEFRSLQGLRNSLRSDIERSSVRSEAIPKATTSQPKLKSLKTSTACCSSLTDVCKENKRYTTNKPQISYGKKEKPANVSSARKKVNPATIPPIPTKRPKVIANKKLTDPTDVKELETDLTIFKNANLKKDDGLIPNTATATEIIPSIEPNTQTTATTFDPNIPCCSYQLPPQSSTSTSTTATTFNSFKYPTNVVNKTGTFQRKSSASSVSAIKLRSSFSGAGIESRTLRKSSLTKDGRRMKKKKTLKADTGLKRKKSKVF